MPCESCDRVSNSQAERDAELGCIQMVMMRNGYPRKFINKVGSSQIKQQTTSCVLKQQKKQRTKPAPKLLAFRLLKVLGRKYDALPAQLALGAHFHSKHVVFSLYIEGPTPNRFIHQCRVPMKHKTSSVNM